MSDTEKQDAVLTEFRGRPFKVIALADEILRLSTENAALRAAVERVRALHYGRDVSDGLHHACRECEQAYPCPTLRALEETP